MLWFSQKCQHVSISTLCINHLLVSFLTSFLIDKTSISGICTTYNRVVSVWENKINCQESVYETGQSICYIDLSAHHEYVDITQYYINLLFLWRFLKYFTPKHRAPGRTTAKIRTPKNHPLMNTLDCWQDSSSKSFSETHYVIISMWA